MILYLELKHYNIYFIFCLLYKLLHYLCLFFQETNIVFKLTGYVLILNSSDFFQVSNQVNITLRYINTKFILYYMRVNELVTNLLLQTLQNLLKRM